jgi:hypothetical protein
MNNPMNNPKLNLLLLLVPVAALAVYLAMYQVRHTNSQQANEPAHQVVEQQALEVPSPNAPVLATVAPAVTVSDPAELPTDTVDQDREFIGRAFPLLSTWNLPEVKPLLSPATIEASSDEELAAVMSTLKERLGSLQRFDEPQPVPMAVDGAADLDDQALQQYQFIAYYDAGAAEVNLILEKHSDTHALYSFDINIPQ